MTAFPKINYIGNKEKIARWIVSFFPDDATSLFDAFSGSCSVAYLAKQRGMRVVCNDIMAMNHRIAQALIENTAAQLTADDVETIFGGEPFSGFMTASYADHRYFADECRQLDLYRSNISRLPDAYRQALALILMRRAMIRKMPYSRFNIKWEKVQQLRDEDFSYAHYGRRRAYHNQSFRHHFMANLPAYNAAVFDNGQPNRALNMDVFDALRQERADIVYLDPPYAGTLNDYYSFYGLLDDYIAGRHVPPFANYFANRDTALATFERLFASLQHFKYWLLSYNSVSVPTKEQLEDIIRRNGGDVTIVERDYAYKLSGKEMKNKNREYLFIAKNLRYEPTTAI